MTRPDRSAASRTACPPPNFLGAVAAALALALPCVTPSRALAGDDVWGAARSTRTGDRITQPRVEGAVSAQYASDFGSEILLTPTELIIAAQSGDDSSFLTPVTVWRKPVVGDATADPAPSLGWWRVQDLLPLPVPETPEPGLFGAALAGDDSWLFVGAPGTAVEGFVDAGVVHVYRRQADGAWAGHVVLANPSPTKGARFGTAIDFDGTMLVVGAPGRLGANGVTSVGGADGYVVDGERLQPAFTYAAPTNLVSALAVGRSVAVDGELVAIGDPDAVVVPGVAPGLALLLEFSAGPKGALPGVLQLEQLLTVPTFADGAGFGTRMDMDEGRLVVTAPANVRSGPSGEDASAGTVHVFRRSDGMWIADSTIAGIGSSYERCALEGDLLAIGAPGHATPGKPATGGLWLYRVWDGGHGIEAEVVPDPDVALPTLWMGRAVSLAGGTLAFTETIDFASATGTIRSVRAIDLTASLDDCDGNGATNLAEVLAGAPDCDSDSVPDGCVSVADCDGNGNPDACDVAWAPAWNLDVPPSPVWWGLLGHGPFDDPNAMLFVVRCQVPEGSDGVLRGVAADWISLDKIVQPCAVSVYTDPDQDGDPSDALVQWKSAVTPTLGPGLEHVQIDPVPIGPAGTTYFIGLALSRYIGTPYSMLVREAQFQAGQEHITWVGFNVPEALDIDVPSANEGFSNDSATNVGVAGLFRPAADLDGDLVPDQCGCVGDLDGDTAVGPMDLGTLLGSWGSANADLTGDGTTDAADLAVLLGAWGPC